MKLEYAQLILTLKKSERMVLPGVGAFANAMNALNTLNRIEFIQDIAISGKPLLGICLGIQLLFDKSEEFGSTQGLGIISGK